MKEGKRERERENGTMSGTGSRTPGPRIPSRAVHIKTVAGALRSFDI